LGAELLGPSKQLLLALSFIWFSLVSYRVRSCVGEIHRIDLLQFALCYRFSECDFSRVWEGLVLAPAREKIFVDHVVDGASVAGEVVDGSGATSAVYDVVAYV